MMMTVMRSGAGRLLRRSRALVAALPSVQHQSSSLVRETTPHVSSPFTSLRFLSSSSSSAPNKVSADDKLTKVIQSEIECAESDAQDQVGLPANFPFEIVDNPGEQTITLKRDIAGETILLEVHVPDMVDADAPQDQDDDDDQQSEDDDSPDQFTISLIVTVVKGDGPRLEFSCTATPDEITIDSMLMKDPDASPDQILYEGPEFSDLDENLQKAFYTYLEDRGIKSSLTNFLQEYMINKDNREYLTWLKSMKEFVEK